VIGLSTKQFSHVRRLYSNHLFSRPMTVLPNQLANDTPTPTAVPVTTGAGTGTSSATTSPSMSGARTITVTSSSPPISSGASSALAGNSLAHTLYYATRGVLFEVSFIIHLCISYHHNTIAMIWSVRRPHIIHPTSINNC
jgi:hypothetical protein